MIFSLLEQNNTIKNKYKKRRLKREGQKVKGENKKTKVWWEGLDKVCFATEFQEGSNSENTLEIRTFAFGYIAI